jgi:hypothetical protein
MLNMNYGMAIALVMLVGFLWGSWYTFIKIFPKEQIPVFVFWLYIFANVIVWMVVLLGKKILIPDGIGTELQKCGQLVPLILFLGSLFGINIQLTLYLMGRLGIIFSISISSTFGILGGTLVSAVFGGLPENVKLLPLMGISVLLLLATISCQISGVFRDRNRGKRPDGDAALKKTDVFLFGLNVLLGFSFTIATTLCCRSTTNPDGMAPMLFCGFLGLGALIGTFILSSIRMMQLHRWSALFCPGWKLAGYAAIASVCHFGGDIVYMLAAPALSMGVAWPLATTSNLWSYLWGIAAGEYRACGKTAMAFLGCGIALFILGVLLMSYILYW